MRKPVRSDEIEVPLFAKIINSKDEEKDSVPVPGDAQQRSVSVRCLQRIRRRQATETSETSEIPDDKVARATDAWLDTGRRPLNVWEIVNAVTGARFGAYIMQITVSVDRTNRRAVVTEEKLMEKLQKHQMGAVSAGSLKPDYGNRVKRFLCGNAARGVVLLLKTYRDSVAAVRERKCNGTALASDKGVVVEAKQGYFPSDLSRVFPGVVEDIYILQNTVKTRGGGRYHFVAEKMKDAQAKCLRQVSTSVWKCAFNLTRAATPSTRLLDGVCSMAWTATQTDGCRSAQRRSRCAESYWFACRS